MGKMEKELTEPVVSFGPYRFDPEKAQLWRGVQEVRLTGKAFGVLRYFVEHPGQLVSKDELFAAVWPQTVVTESTLASCIQELRQALRDDARKPRYVETVHRRGYRFLPAITTQPVPGFRFQVPSGRPREASPRRGTLNLEHGTPLVGREPELTQLHSWLAKALSGERQLVFVTGEAGIGKTALVDTFLQSLASSVQGLASSEQQDRQKAKIQRQKPALSIVEGAKIENPTPDTQSLDFLGAMHRALRRGRALSASVGSIGTTVSWAGGQGAD